MNTKVFSEVMVSYNGETIYNELAINGSTIEAVPGGIFYLPEIVTRGLLMSSIPPKVHIVPYKYLIAREIEFYSKELDLEMFNNGDGTVTIIIEEITTPDSNGDESELASILKLKKNLILEQSSLKPEILDEEVCPDSIRLQYSIILPDNEILNLVDQAIEIGNGYESPESDIVGSGKKEEINNQTASFKSLLMMGLIPSINTTAEPDNKVLQSVKESIVDLKQLQQFECFFTTPDWDAAKNLQEALSLTHNFQIKMSYIDDDGLVAIAVTKDITYAELETHLALVRNEVLKNSGKIFYLNFEVGDQG